MRTTRRWTLLAFLAGIVTVAVLGASPASADVDCADLKTQSAAQSYLDGRAGDPDGLDADADGQACEANDPATHGNWVLLGLAVLLVGGLITFSTDADRQARKRTVAVPTDDVALPLPVAVPVPVEAARVEVVAVMSPPGRNRVLVSAAPDGTIGELARALRLVQYADRMSLLEDHARSHGSPPQDVLDALADHTSDLELQGWALAGYDPPWFVRPMYCECVDGLRNYRLKTADDGTHYWSCASCHASDRQTS
jgi:hypothetical protein